MAVPVYRIQPDMLGVGGRWFPLPYVLLLRDLAKINQGQALPRIPQSATEAHVRLASERRRQLLTRPGIVGGREASLPAARLHAPEFPRTLVGRHPQVDPRAQQSPARAGFRGAVRQVPLEFLKRGLRIAGVAGRVTDFLSGTARQQQSHQDPRQ